MPTLSGLVARPLKFVPTKSVLMHRKGLQVSEAYPEWFGCEGPLKSVFPPMLC